jgi:hypothetical protein
VFRGNEMPTGRAGGIGDSLAWRIGPAAAVLAIEIVEVPRLWPHLVNALVEPDRSAGPDEQREVIQSGLLRDGLVAVEGLSGVQVNPPAGRQVDVHRRRLPRRGVGLVAVSGNRDREKVRPNQHVLVRRPRPLIARVVESHGPHDGLTRARRLLRQPIQVGEQGVVQQHAGAEPRDRRVVIPPRRGIAPGATNLVHR